MDQKNERGAGTDLKFCDEESKGAHGLYQACLIVSAREVDYAVISSRRSCNVTWTTQLL